MERKDELKEAGTRLGINTTGTLLDSRFYYVFNHVIPTSE